MSGTTVPPDFALMVEDDIIVLHDRRKNVTIPFDRVWSTPGYDELIEAERLKWFQMLDRKLKRRRMFAAARRRVIDFLEKVLAFVVAFFGVILVVETFKILF